ncbi:MAG: tol-pal system protein YbgF [Deltaproteobacteria bacterium]|nr:tol-pal system protein YbgF [Deltaproteobacteria bacterium]
MKNCIPLLLIVCVIHITGCATTKDLQRVHGEFDGKIAQLKEDNANIRKDIEKINEAIVTSRKSQAEINADVTDIKDNIQKLKGATEQLRKDTSLLKEIKEKLDNASFKINFIENFLGIGKKENHANGEKPGKIAAKTTIKGKGNKESAYAAAYESFKEGKYEKARDEFQNFLKQYPDAEYSDNAQFWIGECYYFEKQYEKAILEYEKVVKNYPGGNKVPYALLKQGLSFLNLGDRSSAGLILQRVIKEYPNTNQARIARAKLLEIK